MIYEVNTTLESYLCDRTDHLSLWGAGRLMQEAAEHHTHETHIGWLDLIKQNKAWVLCRMHYEIKYMPSLFANLAISTWSRGVNGLYAVRDFSIADSSTCVTASAYWAVIDFTQRRVVRLGDMMDGYEHHSCQATSLDNLSKLRLGDFSAPQRQEQFKVTESMLDHTQHVNNADYLNWMTDVLPQEVLDASQRFVNQQIDIDYILETRPNEIVSVVRQTEGDTHCCKITNPRGTAAVMRLMPLV